MDLASPQATPSCCFGVSSALELQLDVGALREVGDCFCEVEGFEIHDELDSIPPLLAPMTVVEPLFGVDAEGGGFLLVVGVGAEACKAGSLAFEGRELGGHLDDVGGLSDLFYAALRDPQAGPSVLRGRPAGSQRTCPLLSDPSRPPLLADVTPRAAAEESLQCVATLRAILAVWRRPHWETPPLLRSCVTGLCAIAFPTYSLGSLRQNLVPGDHAGRVWTDRETFSQRGAVGRVAREYRRGLSFEHGSHRPKGVPSMPLFDRELENRPIDPSEEFGKQYNHFFL